MLPSSSTTFSKRELSELLAQQAANYAILLLDAEGAVLSCSESAASVSGFDPAAVLGRPLFEAYPPAERESIIAELQECAVAGHVSSIRQLPLGEGTVWVEESTTALRGLEGAIAGYGRIVRDASQQKASEQGVAKANEELHQFAFSVSHDLQEPLRSVRSYSELLARRYKEQLDSDAKDFLEFIVEGATRMGQLLRDLLAYSQAGRPDRTRPESTSSEAVLQWSIMNLSNEIRDSGAKITHNGMPLVRADQAQLAIIFQQLIENSIKYRSEAAPEIHISAKARPDGMWEFSFRDNGTGVDPQFTERVFGVFKRLVGKGVPGTGIGLAICRKIVEAHGGRMWMDSEPGKGADVKFTLPANG